MYFNVKFRVQGEHEFYTLNEAVAYARVLDRRFCRARHIDRRNENGEWENCAIYRSGYLEFLLAQPKNREVIYRDVKTRKDVTVVLPLYGIRHDYLVREAYDMLNKDGQIASRVRVPREQSPTMGQYFDSALNDYLDLVESEDW